MSANILTALQDIGRPVAYFPSLNRVTGSPMTTIFLCQLMYWTPRTAEQADGWLFKTQEEWLAETGLTRRNQETARKRLRELGILEEQRAGLPARLYYRINAERFQELWEGGGELVDEPVADLDGSNGQSGLAETTILMETGQTSVAENANLAGSDVPTRSAENAKPLLESSSPEFQFPKTETTHREHGNGNGERARAREEPTPASPSVTPEVFEPGVWETAQVMLEIGFVQDERQEVERKIARVFELVPKFSREDGPLEAERFGCYPKYATQPPKDWYRAFLNWTKNAVTFAERDAMRPVQAGTNKWIEREQRQRLVLERFDAKLQDLEERFGPSHIYASYHHAQYGMAQQPGDD